MGCTTCNQKKESGGSIDFIPSRFSNGALDENFLLKVVVFIILLLALPVIMVVLVLQIFLHFFTPKSVKKINHKSKTFFNNLLKRLSVIRYRKEIIKRGKQFENNRDYDEKSELTDIEVFGDDDTNNNEEESK